MPKKRRRHCAAATLSKGVRSATKIESGGWLYARCLAHHCKTNEGSCGLGRCPSPQERQGAECAAAIRARISSLYVLALSTDAAPKINMLDYCTATSARSIVFDNLAPTSKPLLNQRRANPPTTFVRLWPQARPPEPPNSPPAP